MGTQNVQKLNTPEGCLWRLIQFLDVACISHVAISSMRLIYKFIVIKTLDCLCHEHLFNLHNQCCNSEMLYNIYFSLDDIQNVCLCYDVHINMNAVLKKKICCISRIH